MVCPDTGTGGESYPGSKGGRGPVGQARRSGGSGGRGKRLALRLADHEGALAPTRSGKRNQVSHLRVVCHRDSRAAAQ